MNRRRFSKWALWLLPVLAVRAFLPVGFMLSADADGLHLGFCPSQSPALVRAYAAQATTDHSAHALDHSQHHSPAGLVQGAHDTDEVATTDAPCPYALAAVAIARDVPRLATDLPALDDELVSFGETHSPTTGPLRADRIRGPPILS